MKAVGEVTIASFDLLTKPVKKQTELAPKDEAEIAGNLDRQLRMQSSSQRAAGKAAELGLKKVNSDNTTPLQLPGSLEHVDTCPKPPVDAAQLFKNHNSSDFQFAKDFGQQKMLSDQDDAENEHEEQVGIKRVSHFQCDSMH